MTAYLASRTDGQPVVLPNWNGWEFVAVGNTLTTNVTTVAKRRIFFEYAEYDINLNFSGANTQGVITITLPTGDVIDNTAFADPVNYNLDPLVSNVTIQDFTGISRYFGRVHANNSTTVRIYNTEAQVGATFVASTPLNVYSNLVDTSANRPMVFAVNDSINIRFQVPLARLAAGYSSLSGRSLSGTSTEEWSNSTTAVGGVRYEYDMTLGPYTLTLPSGTTAAQVSFQDRKGVANDTRRLNLDPGSNNSIDTYANGDIVAMNYANFSGTLFRAAGSTIWYRTKQLTSTIQPGFQLGYTGSAAIAAGYVGENQMIIPTSTVITTLNTDTDIVASTFTLQPGLYLVSYSLQAVVTNTAAGFTSVRLKITTSANVLVPNSITLAGINLSNQDFASTLATSFPLLVTTATSYKMRAALGGGTQLVTASATYTGGLTDPDASPVISTIRIA